MKTAGIVAEYNPFHNGHALHLQAARDAGADAIVAVMSGNYTQRGEPAAMDKWARARAALLCGADVVLELPTAYAVSSAQGFARAAVSLLDATGQVDFLSFGSECGDTDLLRRCATLLGGADIPLLLRRHLAEGKPYPKALQLAVEDAGGPACAALLESANDTLGVEYIRALDHLGSAIRPLAVLRRGAGHDSLLTCGSICSASFLRKNLDAGTDDLLGRYMPAASAGVLLNAIARGEAPASLERAERAVLARLRTMSLREYAALPDLSEGLENRLADAAQKAGSLEELYRLVKTKRYPLSRIRRLVVRAFLGLDETLSASSPPYLRVLGFTPLGLELVRGMKRSARLPVFTRGSQILQSEDPVIRRLFQSECRASDLYGLTLPKPSPGGRELTQPILKLPATGEPV